METEHFENEGMHRLLGDALDHVEFDANVVPAVLAGYERGVRARRYGAAGSAVAVLAATAVASVTLLPGAAGRGVTPTAKGTGPTAAKPLSAKALANVARCDHEHWRQGYAGRDPGGPIKQSADPAADMASCRALMTVLGGLFPDAELTPAYTADLTQDPRIDQKALKSDQDRASQPDYVRDTGAEQKYLAVHPDDPANFFTPGEYTLTTSKGREEFSVVYGLGHQGLAGESYGPECGDRQGVRCVPISGAGGWHGALFTEPPPGAIRGSGTERSAVLADDHGHTVFLTWNGSPMLDWYQVGAYDPDGGAGNPDHGKWINRWTGALSATEPAPTTALTTEQLVALLSAPAFRSYLDGFVTYVSKLPPSPLDQTPERYPVGAATGPSPAH